MTHGIVEVIHGGEEVVCADRYCSSTVTPGQGVAFDTWYDRWYCEQCGILLRYTRKSAHQRGDDPRLIEWND